MYRYEIATKDLLVVVHAPNKKIAWREFFARIRERGWAHQVGMIAVMKGPGWKSEDDNIGFRTYPTLVKMKLLPFDTAADSLALHLGIERGEADKILSESIEKDTWAVPAQAVDLEHDWKGRRLN